MSHARPRLCTRRTAQLAPGPERPYEELPPDRASSHHAPAATGRPVCTRHRASDRQPAGTEYFCCGKLNTSAVSCPSALWITAGRDVMMGLSQGVNHGNSRAFVFAAALAE